MQKGSTRASRAANISLRTRARKNMRSLHLCRINRWTLASRFRDRAARKERAERQRNRSYLWTAAKTKKNRTQTAAKSLALGPLLATGVSVWPA